MVSALMSGPPGRPQQDWRSPILLIVLGVALVSAIASILLAATVQTVG